jgi:thiol-disulfide isomerase/thioredoxin
MPALFKRISNHASPVKVIAILLVVAIFIILAMYIYNKYVIPRLAPKYKENNEFTGNNEDGGGFGTAEIYYFYTEWCPHCKKSSPEWDAFVQEVDGQIINGNTVHCHKIDCDVDSEGLADKFKVESYPTIKMVVGGNVVDYDAKVSVVTLNQFVRG